MPSPRLVSPKSHLRKNWNVKERIHTTQHNPEQLPSLRKDRLYNPKIFPWNHWSKSWLEINPTKKLAIPMLRHILKIYAKNNINKQIYSRKNVTVYSELVFLRLCCYYSRELKKLFLLVTTVKKVTFVYSN